VSALLRPIGDAQHSSRRRTDLQRDGCLACLGDFLRVQANITDAQVRKMLSGLADDMRPYDRAGVALESGHAVQNVIALPPTL